MRTYVYIRDDDVYSLEANFLGFFNLFKDCHIPVIYGIIPGLLEKRLIQFLNVEKYKNPKLFDFIQHGWKHKNYSRNIKYKFEFGFGRSLFQQLNDIKRGFLKMESAFGKDFTPAFAPPYHGYDQNTIEVVNRLKIPIFSVDRFRGFLKKKFVELPTQFSLNSYDKTGSPQLQKTSFVIRLLLKNFKTCSGLLGIVAHHRAIKTSADLEEIKKFAYFLRKLEKKKVIKFILFSDVLKSRLIRSR